MSTAASKPELWYEDPPGSGKYVKVTNVRLSILEPPKKLKKNQRQMSILEADRRIMKGKKK